MMRKYAEGTSVDAMKSRAEIEKTLLRFGADQFMYGSKDTMAVIAFRCAGRHIRFKLPLPSPEKYRSAKALERETRRVWRAMCLCIKAKLESVATGIETFEECFMAHVVMPNGQTLAEHAAPLLEQMHKDGKMPPLLSFDGGIH